MNIEDLPAAHHPLLAELLKVLRGSGYLALQYLPSRKNFFGLFKEYENIGNMFRQKKHLLFYYSAFPGFYFFWQKLRYPKSIFLYQFCFENRAFELSIIETAIGTTWTTQAVQAGLLKLDDGKYSLVFSVLPYDHFLLIRDRHATYQFHELDVRKPQNRVWVGSDSVKFAEMNRRHLAGLKFDRAIELGCGSGIQLLAIEHLADQLEGIDINPRAVKLTNLSAALNGLSSKLKASESNLFAGLHGKFDLILANPWFIDHEQGGLEEIPLIFAELDNYLLPGGRFAMYFGSYVKNGIDQGKTVTTAFARQKGYDATFWHLGKSLEPEALEKYQQLGISHINSYYTILKKTGQSSITERPAGILRSIRDFIFLRLQRILYA